MKSFSEELLSRISEKGFSNESLSKKTGISVDLLIDLSDEKKAEKALYSLHPYQSCLLSLSLKWNLDDMVDRIFLVNDQSNA